ncbi:SRPBCC family protein [Methyloferula stellata]|uniref:SRPBCC family protein n=1 Tax=Methyloferula stellata TaxID=876270 RepID=UPI00047C3C86|nr:SRPBCC family protein [Methyloferula stellata]
MRGMIGLAGAMLLALTSGAWAAEVTEKVEVKATPAAAWAAIGDFCGIKNWHPVIVGCEVKMDGADKVRTLTAKDGAKFVEKQIAWDNGGKSYTYAILTSPLPLTGYKSTLGVTGTGETATITWTGSFTPNAADNGVEKVVSGIYQAGLTGLKTKLETK